MWIATVTDSFQKTEQVLDFRCLSSLALPRSLNHLFHISQRHAYKSTNHLCIHLFRFLVHKRTHTFCGEGKTQVFSCIAGGDMAVSPSICSLDFVFQPVEHPTNHHQSKKKQTKKSYSKNDHFPLIRSHVFTNSLPKKKSSLLLTHLSSSHPPFDRSSGHGHFYPRSRCPSCRCKSRKPNPKFRPPRVFLGRNPHWELLDHLHPKEINYQFYKNNHNNNNNNYSYDYDYYSTPHAATTVMLKLTLGHPPTEFSEIGSPRHEPRRVDWPQHDVDGASRWWISTIDQRGNFGYPWEGTPYCLLQPLYNPYIGGICYIYLRYSPRVPNFSPLNRVGYSKATRATKRTLITGCFIRIYDLNNQGCLHCFHGSLHLYFQTQFWVHLHKTFCWGTFSYGAELIKSLSNQSLHENVSIILRIISNDSVERELEIHLEVII